MTQPTQMTSAEFERAVTKHCREIMSLVEDLVKAAESLAKRNAELEAHIKKLETSQPKPELESNKIAQASDKPKDR